MLAELERHLTLQNFRSCEVTYLDKNEDSDRKKNDNKKRIKQQKRKGNLPYTGLRNTRRSDRKVIKMVAKYDRFLPLFRNLGGLECDIPSRNGKQLNNKARY